MDSGPRKPDWLGGVVGILTFLVGVGLLLLTFQRAYDLFSIEPAKALNLKPNATADLAKTGESFAGILGRILVLLVMSAVGSVIANRGIKLYAESRVAHPTPPAGPKETGLPQPRTEP